MRPVIIVFAKAPRPGAVKTRLQPRLTPAAAAALHTTFVRVVFDSLQPLAGLADIRLMTDVSTDAWPEITVPRRLQREGNLGLRLFHALSESLDEGAPQAMVLGSDSPTLPITHVQALLQATSDVALGPTEDGGYYGIACRRTYPAMFDNVRWSTAHACSDTVQAATAAGLTVSLGPLWWDVDEPADLDRLPAHLRP